MEDIQKALDKLITAQNQQWDLILDSKNTMKGIISMVVELNEVCKTIKDAMVVLEQIISPLTTKE